MKIIKVATAQLPHTASGVLKGDTISASPKLISTGQIHQPTSSTVPVQGCQTSPPLVVVTKVATSAAVGTSNEQPQASKAVLNQVASLNPNPTPGRTVVITVPRAPVPKSVTVAPQLSQAAIPQLPTNIHIPPGMMLIRSDSGQLMLVSQQALAQAQQAPRASCGQQAPPNVDPQVTPAAAAKTKEKVTVIRMTAPPSSSQRQSRKRLWLKVIGTPNPALVQTLSSVPDRGSQPRILTAITETKKEPTPTFSQETLESVKKCKNFLVTLIKLASSDSRSANMANNVRGLVRSLLEGKLEAEEFTEQLYRELKSTPQPCLVPFLKKSLPAVRCLTTDPQLFIQQASTSSRSPSTSSLKQSDTGQSIKAHQQVIQPTRVYTAKISRPSSKQIGLQSAKHFTGPFPMRQPLTHDPPHSTRFAFKDSSASYKEDDDINDVASMAGVNLREENAQILTTVVGSVVQSCQDQPFLSPNPVLSRILHTGKALGVTDVGPEVVALVSHATQEYLRGILEKLTLMAEHRKSALKEDQWSTKVSDVRAQLRFLEEVESLKKKKKDEEEKERLLRLARRRSHMEDPLHQQLKQRAKELQQMEEAQLQQREANLTALAAIGPRKKRPLEHTDSQVCVLPRPGVQRVNRVMLKDLLQCMEQDHFLRHSLTLYRAML
ncbi:LOW QUALITY PROTEIN: transcription initiation factor TFIID subunit 4B-like [Sphaeramia orbicularis]|uniref:LOW QUALITY PROTEIN: transcription initiation factor TFIID subunit 4B-like n=1 Tax=Sphaeramia orbicularis TaxID=375764 RepID=UPI00118117BD|nr:LOW QUALITY PROTEIN: transcription initiation factor TFIID subunit 4B-like [Sphaeramia orbicularis]